VRGAQVAYPSFTALLTKLIGNANCDDFTLYCLFPSSFKLISVSFRIICFIVINFKMAYFHHHMQNVKYRRVARIKLEKFYII